MFSNTTTIVMSTESFNISELSTPTPKRGRGRPAKAKASDGRVIAKQMEKEEKDRQKEEDDAEMASLKQKVVLYDTYFPDIKYPGKCNNLADLRVAYNYYKERINEEHKMVGIESIVRSLVAGVDFAAQMIYATNPTSMVGRGASTMIGVSGVYSKHPEIFEQEIKELRIEYPWLVPGGLLPRIVWKFQLLIKLLHQERVEAMEERLNNMNADSDDKV